MAGGFWDNSGGSSSPSPASSSFWKGAPAPKPSGGGGGIGGVLSSIGHVIGSGAHWTASKADLAAHDIAAMPGGAVSALDTAVVAPWKNFLTSGHPYAHGQGQKIDRLVNQTVQGTVESIAHPLRDPFATALNVLPAAHGLASGATRGAIAADAARAGDLGGAAKALVQKPDLGPRVLQVPKLVVPTGEGPAQLVHEPVQLVASQAPFTRLLQAGHDALVQRALDRNVSAAEPSSLANYAMGRVGKATSETARTAQRTQLVPTQMLEGAGRGFDKGVTNATGQLALFLRSANVTGDEAATYWRSQAHASVNPGETGKLARAAQSIHDRGLLTLGPDGNVAVDAARFPKLGAADQLVRENQATREGIIGAHDLMTPEGLQTRKALVAETMRSEAARNPETGVREGQGYTPLRTSVKQPPQTGIARARVPLIGRARFTVGKPATGAGVAKGLVPDNTTAGVARATREALRYLGTVEHRGLVANYGSDVRRTGEDVLVADPAAEHYAAEIPASTNEILGRSRSTLNTISEAEHIGLAQAMRAKLEEAIPGLGDNFAADREAQLGARAPLGYKWVPRQALGDLVQDATPRTTLTKRINDVNSAVTAATVYFKLSHIPQRLTTNATTSAVLGSLFNPASLRAAIVMRKALSDREYAEAVAASGTHGYLALPHEGTSAIAGIATKGANFYAHRIDSPFRFLNLVHVARKAGFDTPDKFRQLIDFARKPDSGAPDAQAMTQVLRRANRVSMMYDGLGQQEKRILARGLWFYGWTKAAARFAGHTAAEHPFKAYTLGQLGQLGQQQQNALLGALPSYEYGLTPFSGGATTGDLSVLTPFGTAGQIAELAARPAGLVGNLNPVYGAGLTAMSGVDQYGSKTTSPLGDAASELFASTPEAQILSAYMHPAKPTQIFHKTPGSQALRAVFGPSLPRRTNRAALAKAAAREKSGR